MPLPLFKRIKSTNLWIGLILGGFLILFIIAFRHEIGDMFLILGRYTFLNNQPLPDNIWFSFFILLFTIVLGFVATAAIWIFIVSSHSILPLSNFYEDEFHPKSLLTRFQEIMRVAHHLLLYIQHSHGPAVFIQNGKELSTPEEKRRPGPGVLVVDFNSAVILEQQLPRASIMMPIRNSLNRLNEILGLSDPMEKTTVGGFASSLPQRARGPGIVYTRGLERIRGVIDLRKQSRFAKDITTHTRDGIEVTTDGIITIFSVGEEPDVIQVTLMNGRKAEHLCVVSTKIEGDNLIITPLPDEELTEDDRQAIFKSISQAKSNRRPYEEIPEIALLPTFNAKRVFEAISSQAARGDTEVPWTELPLDNAKAIYRDLISNYNYNLLTQDPLSPDAFNLPRINNRFRVIARNSGLLSYRLLFHFRGKLLESGAVPIDQVRVSPIYPLPPNPKAVLRERGIKMIHAGFLPLRPVFEGVTQQRFANWRAQWESEITRAQAIHGLDATRIHNQALASAQSEMITVLTELFNNQQYSEEAVALRVLQELENAVENPGTNKLVPPDTINLLRAAFEWLPRPDANRNDHPRP